MEKRMTISLGVGASAAAATPSSDTVNPHGDEIEEEAYGFLRDKSVGAKGSFYLLIVKKTNSNKPEGYVYLTRTFGGKYEILNFVEDIFGKVAFCWELYAIIP